MCRIYAVPPLGPQDLFQEVVFQLWKSFSSFQAKSHINTWVYRVGLNVCLDAKIKGDRRRNKMVRLESVEFFSSPEVDKSEAERFQALHACIATLKESDKSLVILYLEALPYKEIAMITGLTENHVAVKMKRIREKLFACLAPKLK